MNDFLWNTFEIVVTLCEQFIVYYFMCSFLKHDFKTSKGKVVYVFGSISGAVLVTFLNYFTLYDWWLSAIYIAYWFVYALLFLNGKVLSKLLAAVISDLVIIGSSNLITGIFSIILKSSLDEIYAGQNMYRVIGAILCQTMNIYLYGLILKVADKTILLMKKKEWFLIISVFLISIFSLAMIHIALNEAALSDTTSNMLLLTEIGLFGLNIICLYITVSLNKSNRTTEELKLKEQQYMHNIQYAEAVRSQYQEIRNIRHDMKQHLAAVSGLQIEGKLDAAQKYVSEISSSIDRMEMFMDVGNDFVNAILNSKLSVAKSKGIEVLCNSSSEVGGINEFDLCNLIGNMLDNAIEAAEKTGDYSVVEVSILSDKYKLMITVSNSILQSVLNGNPTLKTTKYKSDLHGFGVKSINAIAEKYNGSVDYYEEKMTFICRVILGKEIE